MEQKLSTWIGVSGIVVAGAVTIVLDGNRFSLWSLLIGLTMIHYMISMEYLEARPYGFMYSEIIALCWVFVLGFLGDGIFHYLSLNRIPVFLTNGGLDAQWEWAFWGNDTRRQWSNEPAPEVFMISWRDLLWLVIWFLLVVAHRLIAKGDNWVRRCLAAVWLIDDAPERRRPRPTLPTLEEWRGAGQLHREGGAARIQRDPVSGTVLREEWWRNGKCHRESAPAVIERGPNGAVTRQEWWLDGVQQQNK